MSADKIDQLLQYLDCSEQDLPDFGYYPADKKGEYLTYESNTDLRDSESVPPNDSIRHYFLAEVKPHVHNHFCYFSFPRSCVGMHTEPNHGQRPL